MLAAARPLPNGLTSWVDSRRIMQHPRSRTRSGFLRKPGHRRREMNRMKFLAGLCLTALLAAVPAFAQTDAKPKEPQKPALTGSAAILDQWNDIGRKLIAIAEDLPEDK